jgi:predicted ribosomally synthesized peptide with nif11-like leader
VTKRDALAFLSALAKDSRLSQQIVTKEDVMKAAEEAGFSVEWEELESVVREIKGSGDEVSDDILDQVAAGLSMDEIQAWVGENLKKLLGF